MIDGLVADELDNPENDVVSEVRAIRVTEYCGNVFVKQGDAILVIPSELCARIASALLQASRGEI